MTHLSTPERRAPFRPISTATEDPLRDPAHTAQRLGVTRNALAMWRCSQRYQLPFIKIGRLIRYRESDIQAFLHRHTVAS
jgi:predicted DNA-binding transcriptional regulator AlpA